MSPGKRSGTIGGLDTSVEFKGFADVSIPNTTRPIIVNEKMLKSVMIFVACFHGILKEEETMLKPIF